MGVPHACRSEAGELLGGCGQGLDAQQALGVTALPVILVILQHSVSLHAVVEHGHEHLQNRQVLSFVSILHRFHSTIHIRNIDHNKCFIFYNIHKHIDL